MFTMIYKNVLIKGFQIQFNSPKLYDATLLYTNQAKNLVLSAEIYAIAG